MGYQTKSDITAENLLNELLSQVNAKIDFPDEKDKNNICPKCLSSRLKELDKDKYECLECGGIHGN